MRIIILCIGIFLSPLTLAEDIVTVDSKAPFAEAITKLQDSVLRSGYEISIIQRCDYGLKQAGFDTEKYRVVYFGRHEEVKAISDAYPGLAPFLPLRILVMGKGNTSSLSVMNPALFLETVTDPTLIKIVKRWQGDVMGLLEIDKRI